MPIDLNSDRYCRCRVARSPTRCEVVPKRDERSLRVTRICSSFSINAASYVVRADSCGTRPALGCPAFVNHRHPSLMSWEAVVLQPLAFFTLVLPRQVVRQFAWWKQEALVVPLIIKNGFLQRAHFRIACDLDGNTVPSPYTAPCSLEVRGHALSSVPGLPVSYLQPSSSTTAAVFKPQNYFESLRVVHFQAATQVYTTYTTETNEFDCSTGFHQDPGSPMPGNVRVGEESPRTYCGEARFAAIAGLRDCTKCQVLEVTRDYSLEAATAVNSSTVIIRLGAL
ncbi:hypothetical protein GQ600_22795 [Phytophthora cactorum]|nr:hypothetical protein GQ600_22795 [Phytophthora cactorum]